MRKWVVGVTSAFLLLLPQFAWGNGERARVGVSTMGNLETRGDLSRSFTPGLATPSGGSRQPIIWM
jgi:hypothetical protein